MEEMNEVKIQNKKERRRAVLRKYHSSKKGKEAHKKYRNSEKGKETKRKYRATEISLAYDREYRALNKDNIDVYVSRYRSNNPKKITAHWKASRAKKRGILVPRPCEVCGSERVEMHHDDYDKPLLVRWLCRTHHNEFHRLNK